MKPLILIVVLVAFLPSVAAEPPEDDERAWPHCGTLIETTPNFPFVNFVDACWCPMPDGSWLFCQIVP